MNILLGGAAAVAIAVAAAFAFAPRSALETEVFIAASPAQVWAVLADAPSYQDWNPFIRSMEGELVVGERIQNVMQPIDGSPMTFNPVVLAATPGEELRWLGGIVMPRVMDAEHYFELEAVEGGTRVTHGERFHGIAMWFMSAEQFEPSFIALNDALKQRVEGLGATAE